MQAENRKDFQGPVTGERVEELMASLDPSQREKVTAILRDEDRLRALLSSPEAARLMETLGGKK